MPKKCRQEPIGLTKIRNNMCPSRETGLALGKHSLSTAAFTSTVIDPSSKPHHALRCLIFVPGPAIIQLSRLAAVDPPVMAAPPVLLRLLVLPGPAQSRNGFAVLHLRFGLRVRTSACGPAVGPP